jgi:hypothetical protein
LRITGELKIFLGYVGGIASDFHVRSVGLVHAREGILVVMMVMATTFTAAIATAHTLVVVLTVSHDLLFRQPPLCATAPMPPLFSVAVLTVQLLFSLNVTLIRTHRSEALQTHPCTRHETLANAALTIGITAVL